MVVETAAADRMAVAEVADQMRAVLVAVVDPMAVAALVAVVDPMAVAALVDVLMINKHAEIAPVVLAGVVRTAEAEREQMAVDQLFRVNGL